MITEKRKEKERHKRRKAILLAAEKVFFTSNGTSSTMDEVAEKAQLSKGTLYLYFKNREDILHALALKGAMKLASQLESVYQEGDTGLMNLSDLGDEVVRFALANKDYIALILKFESPYGKIKTERGKIIIMEKVLDTLSCVLEKGKADGTIRTDISTPELVSILWSQMLGILQTVWHKNTVLHEKPLDQDWIIKGHFRIVMQGIVPQVK
ncbi:MAG: TetR/AcrR family transcriptional regulator [Bacteroidetes bacterium]|nr:TetR/AcrR family transcriptional regulator [Bacteroidota bacterium]